MVVVWVALVCFAAQLTSASLQARFYEDYTFEKFVEEYDRSYGSVAEWNARKAIFAENLKFIRNQNQAYVEGRSKWVAAMNHFGDMSQDDMQAFRGLPKRSLRKQNARETVDTVRAWHASHAKNGSLPESVDWRKKGVVTTPKDQGGCGDCW